MPRSIVTRIRSRACTVGAAMLLLASLFAESLAEGVPDAVRQAWQRRQDAAATARFEWRAAPQADPDSPGSAPLLYTPPPDSLMLQGNKCRYSTDTDGNYLCTFDGLQCMSMRDSTTAGLQHFGTIFPQPRFRDVNSINLQALTLFLRPLEPGFQVHCGWADFDLASSSETIDGRPCLLLRQRDSTSKNGIVQLLYVDPAREYVVLRSATEKNGRLSTKVDVTYAPDAAIGWAPSGWTYIWMRDGVVTERSTSVVTDYALGEPLADKLFVIDFPPGTFVHDQPAATEYLIREGGQKRPIAPAERKRQASWEQLMATEYGKAGLRPAGWSARTIAAGIGALAALCVAIFFLLRRYEKAGQ